MTIDQLFGLKQVMGKVYKFSIDLHLVSIDFKQACDTLDKNVLKTTFKGIFNPQEISYSLENYPYRLEL
jgi:hypothetical protein